MQAATDPLETVEVYPAPVRPGQGIECDMFKCPSGRQEVVCSYLILFSHWLLLFRPPLYKGGR